MTAPILITGGAQRLGLAIAEDLLAKDYDIIITYRTKKPSVDALISLGATAIHADFSTNNGVEEFISKLNSKTHLLRAIIHNASDWVSEKSDSNLDVLFNKMMQVHANAPYIINMKCHKMLQDPSDIIHMTDFVQDKGSKKHIAYSASKAALHNLTLSFSAKLAPRTKVNSIAPSLLMFNEHDSDEYKEKALSKSLMGIAPGASEAVNAVKYLLNSRYITGQVLHLNGGRHLK